MDTMACVGELCDQEGPMRHLLASGEEVRDKILTSAVLVIGLFVLFKDWVRTEFVMIGMNLALVWMRIIDVKSAVEGFASTGILTVMGVILVMMTMIFHRGELPHIVNSVLILCRHYAATERNSS